MRLLVVGAASLGLAAAQNASLRDAPNNCDFAKTFNDDNFECYNEALGATCGAATDLCPPQFCTHQCQNGQLSYYDCSKSDLPPCPPSESGYPADGYAAENPLGAVDRDDYVNAAHHVAYVDRQDQFKRWAEGTATDAFRARAANSTDLPETFAALASHEAILAAYYRDADVRGAVVAGMDLLPDGYWPSSHRHAPAASELRDFDAWAQVAGPAVAAPVAATVKYAAAHAGSTWDLGCATWNTFNFFVDGSDASKCDHYPLPDGARARAGAAAAVDDDPQCLSRCQSCMGTSIGPGTAQYCLWDDYATGGHGTPPETMDCFPQCPSSGTTRTLWGTADSIDECFSLCDCNGSGGEKGRLTNC